MTMGQYRAMPLPHSLVKKIFLPSLLYAAFGLSLAMLGPGAWSIDARLFGRKYFDFKPKSGG
jgi:uncharacterized membrane protein YphA (DoxX/SURF4 family)